MLELWLLAAIVVWVGLMTLVVALCVASGRADRDLVRLRPALRPRVHRARRVTHA
jgi:hypothetical protein